MAKHFKRPAKWIHENATDLGGFPLALLVNIYGNCGKKDYCFWHQGTMASHWRVDISTINRLVKEFETLGYLEIWRGRAITKKSQVIKSPQGKMRTIYVIPKLILEKINNRETLDAETLGKLRAAATDRRQKRLDQKSVEQQKTAA